jgi:hypothetical protein
MKRKQREKIDGTYCPLCGMIGLLRDERGGQVWAYCPGIDGEATLDTAHTAYVVGLAEPTKGETR